MTRGPNVYIVVDMAFLYRRHNINKIIKPKGYIAESELNTLLKRVVYISN